MGKIPVCFLLYLMELYSSIALVVIKKKQKNIEDNFAQLILNICKRLPVSLGRSTNFTSKILNRIQNHKNSLMM